VYQHLDPRLRYLPLAGADAACKCQDAERPSAARPPAGHPAHPAARTCVFRAYGFQTGRRLKSEIKPKERGEGPACCLGRLLLAGCCCRRYGGLHIAAAAAASVPATAASAVDGGDGGGGGGGDLSIQGSWSVWLPVLPQTT
jgi:hypothetical protein